MSVTIYLKKCKNVELPTGAKVEPDWLPRPDDSAPGIPAIVVRDRDGSVLGHFAQIDITGYKVDQIQPIRIIEIRQPPDGDPSIASDTDFEDVP